HLDVVEPERAEADAERLHHRLLSCEARRQALRRVAPAGPGSPLALGEEATHDARGAGNHPAEAVDLDGVDADTRQGVVLHRSARRWMGCSRRSTTGISPSRSSRKTGSVSVTASRRMAYRPRYPWSTLAATAGSRRSWNRAWSNVSSVVWLSLVSGTRMNVRPSL